MISPLIVLLACGAKLSQAYSLYDAQRGSYGAEGYSDYSSDDFSAKGHDFKAKDQGFYDDHGGAKKGYAHNDKYFVKINDGNQGEQGYKFVDGERYAKGYSIKGAHNVHKLNEFAKNTDFYDQNHDEAYKEDHGSFEQAYDKIKAKSTKGGLYEDAYLEDKFGHNGRYASGSYGFDEIGHVEDAGDLARYANEAEFERVKNSHEFESLGLDHSY